MTNETKMELWDVFKNLGQDALVMSHYDLAEITGTSADIWKTFLMEQDVSDWIDTELKMLQSSELKKIIKDISKSTSVGQAQLANVLMKLKDDAAIKDGPVFIYMYVPPNEEQTKSKNFGGKLQKDIFRKE